MPLPRLILALPLLVACADGPLEATDSPFDTDADGAFEPWWDDDVDPFADRVVLFEPGEDAGFGQDALPDVVLGAPVGGGVQGSLHVLSLGQGGSIVLAFDDLIAVDGPGPDLIVFENPFIGWTEAGEVSVSADGESWSTFPCDPHSEGLVGCAGVQRVWSTPDNGIDPTDPEQAGGDAFDLADLGLDRIRYVRIDDTGTNPPGGPSAGFDLDAIAIVHGERIE